MNIDIEKKILLTTGDSKRDYQIISLVSGNYVVTKSLAKDIWSDIKALFSDKVDSYQKLLKIAREKAINELRINAINMGADGIIFIKENTYSLKSGIIEISFIGTAIKYL